MKVSVSSYSFARYLKDGRLDFPGVVDKAAAMGFEGVEFSGIGVECDDPQALPLARKLKALCLERGLGVVSYTIGADFLQAPGGWRAEARRLEGELAVAAEMGAPRMRHDVTRGFPKDHQGPSDFAAALPTLTEACRAVTQKAAALGVRTMFENHGFFAQDSDRCEALVRAVGHPNFGALVDIGNFLCADEEPAAAVTRMAPLAFHCHAKDFHVKPAWAADPGKGWFRSRGGAYLRGAIVGHGNVDVPACLAALRAAGYDGFMSIEFEGMEDNIVGLEIGLANLRRYLAAGSGQ